MADLSEHEILWNTAALTSLRRPQLVSLSKKYGLKANGKNLDMVNRLQEFGHTLTPASKTIFDYGVHTRAQKYEQEIPSKKMPEPEMSDDDDDTPSAQPSPTKRIHPMPSIGSLHLNGGDAWEVITSGDSSLIEDDVAVDPASTSTSNLPWKSATNGRSLEELEAAKQSSLRESKGPGSLKSLGTSLRRAASRSLSMRKTRGDSPEDSSKPPTILSSISTVEEDQADEDMEVEDASVPDSPASAVGIAKRHSTMSLHKRASTIRLVSGPPLPVEFARVASPEPAVEGELPLTGLNSIDAIKKRRSIQFLDSSTNSHAAQHALNRRSMPVLASPPPTFAPATGSRNSSAPTARLYPDLGAIKGTPTKATTPGAMRSTTPPLPGTFPGDNLASPTSPSFVFGAGNGTSGAAFSDAGIKLLEEMQAKMGGGAAFNPELLKGKRADRNKLVSTNTQLGSGPTGGWGLSAGPSASTDRYAKVHQRQFSKMQSISSISTMNTNSYSSFRAEGTPGTKRKLENTDDGADSASMPNLVNGLPAPNRTTPLQASKDEEKDSAEEGRSAKRTKTVNTPRYLSSMTSIRGAGRAIVSKLSDSVGPSNPTPRRMRSNLRAADQQRRAADPNRPRFPFMGHKRNNSGAASIDSVTSDDFVLAKIPTDKKEKTAPRISKRVSSLMSASTSHLVSVTTGKQRATSSTTMATARAVSSTKSTVASTKSRTPSASSAASGPPVTMMPIKDTSEPVPPPKTSRTLPQARPKSALPLARSTPAGGLGTSVASQASRKASTDSLPPSAYRPGATGSRSSSLTAPTAASLARMQATVKPASSETSASGRSTPVASRPLPRPPKNGSGVSIVGIAPQIPTTSPFGAASSRQNYLFESNFHLGSPTTSKPAATVVSAGTAVPPPTKRPLPTTPSAIPRPSVSTPRALSTPRGLAPGKSPARATVSSAQRARNRESGVSSIKSRGHRDDSSVAQRRAEIKSRQERIKQERELRSMLM